MMQLLHQQFLFFRQHIGMLGVDGGEPVTFHLVFFPVYHTYPFFVIHISEQGSVFHIPLWMLVEYLRFQFKLDNRYRLMHLGGEIYRLVVSLVILAYLRNKFITGIVGVGFHGKSGERYEIDSVSLFQGSEITITQRQSNDVAQTGIVTRTGAHP